LDERGDLPFRLRVAMLGSFGVSARIDRWPECDCATAAAHIALYREKLRAIIHHGDQYLLTKAPPPDGNGDWVALWYAAKDRSGGDLFTFRLGSTEGSRVPSRPALSLHALRRSGRRDHRRGAGIGPLRRGRRLLPVRASPHRGDLSRAIDSPRFGVARRAPL